jgi:general stress protein 26
VRPTHGPPRHRDRVLVPAYERTRRILAEVTANPGATPQPATRVAPMDVASFEEIAGEFQARVARIAWATVATVAADGGPRTRILHPIWVGPVGWIATTAGSLKLRQIAREPRVSLTYWDQQQDNIHIEAVASEVDDPAARARVWELFASTHRWGTTRAGSGRRRTTPRSRRCAWTRPASS